MENTTKTALVFLGTCLGFAEASLGAIVGLSDANGNLIAVFALAALGMVLFTLCFMYKSNPGFLTLAGQQASDLAMLQSILLSRPELVTPEFMKSFMSGNLAQGETGRIDEGPVVASRETEAEELEKALESIRGIQ